MVLALLTVEGTPAFICRPAVPWKSNEEKKEPCQLSGIPLRKGWVKMYQIKDAEWTDTGGDNGLDNAASMSRDHMVGSMHIPAVGIKGDHLSLPRDPDIYISPICVHLFPPFPSSISRFSGIAVSLRK